MKQGEETNPFFILLLAEYHKVVSIPFTVLSHPQMSHNYIKASAVKKLANTHGKRAGKDFLAALDRLVERKTLEALQEHNGGKKTLDGALAGYVLGNK